ncbi:MAG: YebC/PmpR family DNA-binding transcriptional regulator [Candidatus Cloacimonas sp.]|jgi:YebC/PmpR family DNA-binding regulatory protein|nr:YebC/PmpR family DNA-binding transcriptional regulator [Candidatus Cloacimonadota bacterium]
MAGHNKWSSIKHKKGAADAKRGKLFTRLAKEIIIAAKGGSGDIDGNPRLRAAVSAAKGANMPNANIERAIKRGTGEIEGAVYEEMVYEGYGHNGVAIMVEVMTDNKNRTVAEVRHAFSKYGGTLAENGAVSWVFDQKGYMEVEVGEMDEDEAIMLALEAGADDATYEDNMLVVYTSLQDFHTVMSYFEEQQLEIKNAELTRIPTNTVNADDVAEKLLNLIEKLEDLDDTQKVFANFEISDNILEELADN